MIYGTRETFFYALFSLFKFFFGTFLHYFDAIKTCVRNSYEWSWRSVVLNFSYRVFLSLITRKISSVQSYTSKNNFYNHSLVPPPSFNFRWKSFNYIKDCCLWPILIKFCTGTVPLILALFIKWFLKLTKLWLINIFQMLYIDWQR